MKRTLTDSGMEVNPDTVVFFAKLRKEIPRASILMKLINDHNSQSSTDEDLLKNALLAATANRQKETEDFFGLFENQLLQMRATFGV